MIKTTLQAAATMQTPAFIVVPNVIRQQGKTIKDYVNYKDKFLIYCSFKTYGGTEVVTNNVVMLLDTAEVLTWYEPKITANCRLILAEDESRQYDVLGEPENINLSNIYSKLKVQRVKAGA